jgi:hypothetical protein
VTLEEAIDEIYGADLDEFVATRTRLAKQLKQEGDADAAAELAKLRKPNVAAWTLNQLARRNRREVDLLLDAGHRLREAQTGVLKGEDRATFEQAQATQRDALRTLRHEAEQLLASERGGASASVLGQVEESLRAAAVSEDGRELLARGRFETPIRLEGFGALGDLGGFEAAASAPPRENRAEQRRRARAELAKAKDRLREAERAARGADQEVERLRKELAAAENDADAAQAEVEDAEQAVEAAQSELDA